MQKQETQQIRAQNRLMLQGDVFEVLSKIPTGSIHLVITSVPFYQQRNYGVAGQLGLEHDFVEYLQNMRRFQQNISRVLHKKGLFIVEIGDKHAKKQEFGVKKTSLYGIPGRFQSQCIDDGWINLNDIVNYKSNAVPESVKNRLSSKWLPIYMFSKQSKSFFDLDAVKIPAKTASKPFNLRVREEKNNRLKKKYGNKYNVSKKELANHNNKGETLEIQSTKKQDTTNGPNGRPLTNYKNFNETWKKKKEDNTIPELKNPGNMLRFPTARMPHIAHPAMFHEDLAEFFIKCGSQKNMMILDPFLGSGTTCIAAEKLERQWMGIDISQEYLNEAESRVYRHIFKKQNKFIPLQFTQKIDCFFKNQKLKDSQITKVVI